MNTILIGYDLNNKGKDYDGLIARIKVISKRWWHYLDSTWMITTEFSTSQVRDELVPYIDADDELLTMNVTGDAWASQGIDRKGTDWLSQNL